MAMQTPVHPAAEELIAKLQLVPHPEGGYFREMYRSELRVTVADGRDRSAITSILYLLFDEQFSAFHAIASDEIWHFYRGDALAIDVIDAAGRHEQRILGGSGVLQTTLTAGTLFAAHLNGAGGCALVGCDVGPGFDFTDFEMPARQALIARYPQHEELVTRWTRTGPP